ncbi:MAG: CBS domain-containing protein [Gammaproteobacteria bacterium]|nr:CBS domain-containing protein [Gammaproteobacteria bacterium]
MRRFRCRNLVREDFISALREMNTFLDITVDDLMEINSKVEKHAYLRTTGNIRVSDLMTHPVETVHADTTLAEAAHRLIVGKISGLPVVDRQNKLEGIVTEADFLRALGVPSHHPTHSLWQTLETMFAHPVDIQAPDDLVSDVMVSDIVTAAPEQTLHDVLELMKKNRIKRVIVCDAERHVLGIVTRSDLVRVFFDRIRQPSPRETLI